MMADTSDLKTLVATIRANIIGVVRLFALPGEQASYQASVPFINAPDELFCMWGDDLYHPEDAAFRLAFSLDEQAALADFHRVFEQTEAELPATLPALEEFQSTPQAAALAQAAANALARLSTSAPDQAQDDNRDANPL